VRALLSRRLAREAAVRALFQIDVGHSHPEEALAYNIQELAVPEPAADYARVVVHGTLDHLPQIDALISQYTVGWSLDRLPLTDRMVLRLARTHRSRSDANWRSALRCQALACDLTRRAVRKLLGEPAEQDQAAARRPPVKCRAR
jgi:hypothetical protein